MLWCPVFDRPKRGNFRLSNPRLKGCPDGKSPVNFGVLATRVTSCLKNGYKRSKAESDFILNQSIPVAL